MWVTRGCGGVERDQRPVCLGIVVSLYLPRSVLSLTPISNDYMTSPGDWKGVLVKWKVVVVLVKGEGVVG